MLAPRGNTRSAVEAQRAALYFVPRSLMYFILFSRQSMVAVASGLKNPENVLHQNIVDSHRVLYDWERAQGHTHLRNVLGGVGVKGLIDGEGVSSCFVCGSRRGS